MKISKVIILLPIFIFTIISCEKEETCEDELLIFNSLENEYGCVNTQSQLQINIEDDYLIIRNQENFELLVSGDCQPDIDFTIYDLVIGSKGLTSGYDSVEYELIEKCETGNLELNVTISVNSTTIAPLLVYHALVPKIGDEQSLIVNLNY